MSVVCYIALGSNLDSPLRQVTTAVAEISAINNVRLIEQSSWYQTPAIGPPGQPDYINGVIALETSLPPLALLDVLQAIENTHLRIRKERWGPRTLDLDILLYGKQIINTERLTVPHPEIKHRSFVLYPLAEICPQLKLPDGTNVQQLLENCSPGGMVQLSKPARSNDQAI
ncbi:MAG: 2-amino-4-hydroxy-6-hydroxymethyldihydropteridine diphosphokinase [Porticoccaceae bacterium]|nr:2-amino-4-hydroxy-6-hydroxymethyldihydropteridine diphosphokinase [Pseudomonadales bacterium]MCP5173258.1 2-amino-4-hydroxy-6-hydroxymethyldihydropteridine diphosphokinase [Pseudomonadales bacterium]